MFDNVNIQQKNTMTQIFILELYFANDNKITRAFRESSDAEACAERYERNELNENDKTFHDEILTFENFENCDVYRLYVE